MGVSPSPGKTQETVCSRDEVCLLLIYTGFGYEHRTRDFSQDFLRNENPEATNARHPGKSKGHPHGLSSAGANEEWGFDGHEKLLKSMEIGVYGGTDKFSRLELGLYACPNPRDPKLPIAIWIRTVKKYGGEYLPVIIATPTPLTLISQPGMSLGLTCDMGTELGQLIPLVTSLRYVIF